MKGSGTMNKKEMFRLFRQAFYCSLKPSNCVSNPVTAQYLYCAVNWQHTTMSSSSCIRIMTVPRQYIGQYHVRIMICIMASVVKVTFERYQHCMHDMQYAYLQYVLFPGRERLHGIQRRCRSSREGPHRSTGKRKIKKTHGHVTPSSL